jgi:uncharacterized protein YqeY
MTLKEQIDDDMKTAMKAQDTGRLSTVRMLKSALKNAEISFGHELSDAEALSVLGKQAKQRRDSIDQYKAGGRTDLADTEASELIIIETYLPAKLDEKALQELVGEAISEAGATSVSDMGKVIKIVMERAAGAADGKQVSEEVRKRLA